MFDVRTGVSSISFALVINSGTDQLAHTNLPLRNLASGLVTQTLKCAGRFTAINFSTNRFQYSTTLLP